MKIIKIEYCTGCPFQKSTPNHNSEDSYTWYCSHPEMVDTTKHSQKIGGLCFIHRNCPLDDFIESDDFE